MASTATTSATASTAIPTTASTTITSTAISTAIDIAVGRETVYRIHQSWPTHLGGVVMTRSLGQGTYAEVFAATYTPPSSVNTTATSTTPTCTTDTIDTTSTTTTTPTPVTINTTAITQPPAIAITRDVAVKIVPLPYDGETVDGYIDDSGLRCASTEELFDHEAAVATVMGQHGIGPEVVCTCKLRGRIKRRTDTLPTVKMVARNAGKNAKASSTVGATLQEPHEETDTEGYEDDLYDRDVILGFIVMAKCQWTYGSVSKQAGVDMTALNTRVQNKIETMHRLGYVHCDLHKINVMVTATTLADGTITYEPFLIDFARGFCYTCQSTLQRLDLSARNYWLKVRRRRRSQCRSIAGYITSVKNDDLNNWNNF